MPANDQQTNARGTLILVVGPSGVGKDSLIAYCRQRSGDAVSFPRRLITRPAGDSSEDHESLPDALFAARAAAGAFALHWRAHELSYGVPASVGNDLAEGRNVVINVSRAVVDEARNRFAPVVVVSVHAELATLAERIRQRGRETGETIERRLARADEYAIAGPDVVHLDNSGPIEEAGEWLLALIRRQTSG